MKKLITCLLGVVLTAGVSMGQIANQFNNFWGDGLWETDGNWSSGARPTDVDYVFRNNAYSETCTVSSSNTVYNLKIGENGPGLVTLHMQDAWLTLRENQWASVARSASAPSTLTMTNSTIMHLSDPSVPGTSDSFNGHLFMGNVGKTGTLIMDNSKIFLPRGTLRMEAGGAMATTTLTEEIYYDLELNLRTNITTITMNNGSVLEMVSFRNMYDGLIFINSGSYIRGVIGGVDRWGSNSWSDENSLAQLEQLITNGWIIVNGIPITPANRDQYIYTNGTNSISIGDGVLPMVTVPNVVGQAEATARTDITDVGLVVGTVTSNYSATVELGNVISQDPVGGSSVATNSAVDFVVSLGVETPSSPYSSIWTGGVTYGDAGTAPTEDYDSDGTVNLYEYALNGNMQGEIPAATEPVFVRGDGETFVYSVVTRTNDTSLTYNIQTRTDLLSGDWTDTVYDVLSTTPLGGDFVTVKYSIPAASNIYVRLKITMPTP